MAKVLVALTTSLDGFITGPNDVRLLEIMRVVDGPGVTHLRYRVKR